jgi:hypothetical protein
LVAWGYSSSARFWRWEVNVVPASDRATGAPVAFVYARWDEHPKRFKIEITDLIRPRQHQEEDEQILPVTQRPTHDLERLIRKFPQDCLWMHRRWKTYPGKYQRGRCWPSRTCFPTKHVYNRWTLEANVVLYHV